MPTVTHQTAPTQFVEAGEISYAYRRFGSGGEVPLVLLQHFRGNLDNWDPTLIDGLAASREIVLVDYAGVGSSSGAPSGSVAETARHIIAFTEALELEQIDLLGFSLGGFVAQEIALIRPRLVRRLVLAGTGPKGAPGMHAWRTDVEEYARAEVNDAADLLYIFFAHTETSQTLGKQFLGRIFARTENRDAPTTVAVRDAQYDAIVEWGIPDHAALQRLTGIRQPTLVLQGDNDLMVPTKGSYTMAGLIPDARLRIYPDAAHASLFQYPAEAAKDVNDFLG